MSPRDQMKAFWSWKLQRTPKGPCPISGKGIIELAIEQLELERAESVPRDGLSLHREDDREAVRALLRATHDEVLRKAYECAGIPAPADLSR